jgi:hypothetical protein
MKSSKVTSGKNTFRKIVESAVKSTLHSKSPRKQNLSPNRGQVGYNSNFEPYTNPGDYNVPLIVGNKSIVISSIKTPPHFSFQKESRNLDPLTDAIISSFDTNHCNTTRNINNFNSLSKKYKTFVSPGVGDYQIEKVDTKNKSPICTIGHGRRFEKVSSMQRYKMSLPIGY